MRPPKIEQMTWAVTKPKMKPLQNTLKETITCTSQLRSKYNIKHTNKISIDTITMHKMITITNTTKTTTRPGSSHVDQKTIEELTGLCSW
jgi:hypothetical protein